MNFDKYTEEQKERARNIIHRDHRFACTEFLGIKEGNLLPYQHKILESVFKHKRTSVQACHDTGKTFTVALGAIAFFHTHVNCTIISTAPTTNLLQNQLWSEMRNHHKGAIVNLESRIYDGKPEMRINERWFAVGFVPRKDTSGMQSDFQGFHNDWILIIFDEATGIPPKIWDMAESMMTSANVRFIALGNPTDPSGRFKTVCESPAWNHVKITCFDVPNIYENGIRNVQDLRDEALILRSLKPDMRAERVANYKTPWPNLITLEWVMDKYETWGEESPFFQSRVLGEFPKISDDTLISPAMIRESIEREIVDDPDADFGVLGVDVARFGKDSTVKYKMRGKTVIDFEEYQKKDTSETTGIVVRDIQDDDTLKKAGIDDSGLGGGVTDQLKHNSMVTAKCEVIPVNFGAASSDNTKYFNLKAEIFWLLKNDIDEKIKLLDDELTISQLGSIKYTLTPRGQIKIESKEEMKKRGLPSPDRADALAIANYMRHETSRAASFIEDEKKADKQNWKKEESW